MEDFSVITALGRVDSHARREVEGGLPGAVMRADVRQQRTVPGAKERSRRQEGRKEREREVNNVSDREE